MSVEKDRKMLEKLVKKYGAEDIKKYTENYTKTNKGVNESIVDDVKDKIAHHRFEKAKERFLDKLGDNRHMFYDVKHDAKIKICREVYNHNGVAGFQFPDTFNLKELGEMHESGNFKMKPVYFIDADWSNPWINGKHRMDTHKVFCVREKLFWDVFMTSNRPMNSYDLVRECYRLSQENAEKYGEIPMFPLYADLQNIMPISIHAEFDEELTGYASSKILNHKEAMNNLKLGDVPDAVEYIDRAVKELGYAYYASGIDDVEPPVFNLKDGEYELYQVENPSLVYRDGEDEDYIYFHSTTETVEKDIKGMKLQLPKEIKIPLSNEGIQSVGLRPRDLITIAAFMKENFKAVKEYMESFNNLEALEADAEISSAD